MVSIVVPVYNVAEYLEECIQSILSQSYRDIELILVNDGSRDASGEICRKYEPQPNVLYIEQENAGVTVARRRGVEAARGEWIMFVDADDKIMPDAVERMIGKSDGADIVLGSNQKGNLSREADTISRDDFLRRIYERTVSFAVIYRIIRRSLLTPHVFDIAREVVWGEDYLMSIMLAIDNTRPVHVCQAPLYFYRRNPSSVCHTFNYPADYFAELADAADRLIAGQLPEKTFRKSAAIMRLKLFWSLWSRNHFRLDRKHPFVRKTRQRIKEAILYRR